MLFRWDTSSLSHKLAVSEEWGLLDVGREGNSKELVGWATVGLKWAAMEGGWAASVRPKVHDWTENCHLGWKHAVHIQGRMNNDQVCHDHDL
ncbi:hypothetical protein E3N88_13902 [Mikania micrantha]|uniref:Uncharacterized protein n=1 Tax=Mikania micrantha TaxID=192012 RepID=A0A5N6P093_9ASTR|nr:hypothetical protein E3N88_13902 [Mikania micrantha]